MSFLFHYQKRVLFLLNICTKFPILSKRSSAFSSIHNSNMKIETLEAGSPNTLDYRVFFKSENGIISPFHDIPLYSNVQDKIFNMVVEIPRWSNAKMEISLADPFNPIKQDTKKGKLRYVANVFPHHGYIWNYGAFPQTWENPNETDPHTQQKGDGDPIDVLEIGQRIAKRGEIIQVKILGVVGLIDEGQTDWKVITIDVNDPAASKMNDINDIETNFPGLLKATNEWFKIYKMPDGKPENVFALNGEAKNREFALKIVDETNEQWKKLIKGEIKTDDISILNTNVPESSSKISFEKAQIESKISSYPVGPPEPVDPIVDKIHYLHL